ncbi:hypothetical protein FHS68_001905 [Dyadobacter arcticus]|uniref:Uncharacterized protein n=1 Tax=Dyadobacter arcticus TaxID=1078754 RepID=A0ABX0UM30_9BACT|nr:hypothetical protein [Dyadobacter arcticus]
MRNAENNLLSYKLYIVNVFYIFVAKQVKLP